MVGSEVSQPVSVIQLLMQFSGHFGSGSVDCSVIKEEWGDMVKYARKYWILCKKITRLLDGSCLTRLIASSGVTSWLLLNCFLPPYFEWTLGKCLFSAQANKRQSSNLSLWRHPCHLIQINVEGPPLSQWDATSAIELWHEDKVRRVNQKDPRSKDQSTSSATTTSDSDTENNTFCPDDWENWIAPS